jgi:hypothetical protein
MASTEYRPESRDQVISVRTSEAIALFQAGQAGRAAMLTGVGLLLSIATIAASAAVAIESVDPVLPLPAFGLLIAAYVFQQYVDVTVLGAARRRLEELVNVELSRPGLIYESAVAGIRKELPLSRGNRALQVSLAVVGVAMIIGTAYVARLLSDNIWIAISYAVVTLTAGVPAFASYSDMIGSEQMAHRKVAERFSGDERAVWISGRLYDQVIARTAEGESSQSAVEELLESGLSATERSVP